MTRLEANADAARELDMIAQGSNPQQSPAIEDFQKCPDWQEAAAILARALGRQRHGNQAVLAPPARWLPSLL